jgi:hypothetical protein
VRGLHEIRTADFLEIGLHEAARVIFHLPRAKRLRHEAIEEICAGSQVFFERIG